MVRGLIETVNHNHYERMKDLIENIEDMRSRSISNSLSPLSRAARWVLLPLAMLIIIATISAQTSITSTVDKNSITIGDRLTYTVTITYPKNAAVATPSIGANLGAFEIQDFHTTEATENDAGMLVESIIYTISTFTTGQYVIPPLPMLVHHDNGEADTLISQPIEIEVRSLLADKDPSELDIRGIKAPLVYPPNRSWIWYLVVVGIIILLAIAGWLYYRKLKAEGKGLFDFTSPPKPAHVVALERLEQLRNTHYHNHREAKEFFIELSETLREYVEKTYDVEALESTTDETIERMKTKPIEQGLIASTKNVLTLADMVKFAKLMPSDEEGESSWQLTWKFVDRTKPIERADDDQHLTNDSERKRVEVVG